MQTNLPRGIRNNNPLNLRISNNQWLGKVANNTDGSFEQFTTLEHGLRAGIINIGTIVSRRRKQKLKTNVSDLIHIWAPASDGNNEKTYVQTVTKISLIQPTDEIIPHNKNQICRLVQAMAYVECGQRINFGRIENAYAMAYPVSVRNNKKAGNT